LRIPRRIDLISTHPPFFFKMAPYTSPNLLSLPRGLSFEVSPTNIFYSFLFTPMRAAFLSHFTVLDFGLSNNIPSLQMYERPPMWRVAANILNKQ
jgi:hypothetical protein